MIPARLRKPALLTAIVGSVVLVAGAYLRFAPRRVPGGQHALVHLDAGNLRTLRDDFNAAVGGTRLLVLLSPT
jgi:hypothetical protein